MRALRQAIASLAVNHMPRMLYFLGNRAARKGLRVRAARTHIDIVRVSDSSVIRISRANAVYTIDMLDSFDYYFGAVEPDAVEIGGKPFRVVDFSHRRHHRIRGFDDFAVLCPSMAEPFITAEQYMDFAQLEPGHVVLDLGAYSGLTSIAFSKRVGAGGRVVAAEPDPQNHGVAAANIAEHVRVNGLANIDLVQLAVSGSAGVMHLSSEGSMGSADASLVGNYRGKTVAVETCTLSQIVERLGLARVDFVKMEIEGSEEPVIAASRAFFERFRPRIIIEPHIVNGTMSDTAIGRILADYGYVLSTIQQTGVSLPLVTGWPQAAAGTASRTTRLAA